MAGRDAPSLDDGRASLDGIQALRAAAALAVVVTHAYLVAGVQFVTDPFTGTIISSIGTWAVDLFFVISGFIISRLALNISERTCPLSARAALSFALRRISRIFPIYWVYFGAALLLLPGGPIADRLTRDILPMLFLTVRVNAIMVVGWTLAFEVYFYVGTTILIFLAAKHLRLGFGLWGAIQAALIACWMYSHSGGVVSYLIFSPLTLEFLFGAAVATIARRNLKLAIPMMTVSLLFFAAGIFAVHGRVGSFGAAAATAGYVWDFAASAERVLLFGVGSFFLVYSIVALEIAHRIRFPKILVLLGDASYSIYLIHLPFMVILTQFAWRFGIAVPITAFQFVVFWIALPISISLTGYIVLERPILSMTQRGINALSKTAGGERQSRQIPVSSEGTQRAFLNTTAAFGMTVADLGDDVGEISLRFDAAEVAGLDQRSDVGPVLAATIGADQQRVG